MKQLLLPEKIVKASKVVNVENLFIKKPLQPILRREDDFNDTITTINPNGFIVLDFGMEMSGGIRIITNSFVNNNSSRVRIRFGESLSETYSDIGEKGATNDHSQRDFVISLSMFGNITIGDTGFRFVRIDVLDDVVLRIQNIFCENYILSIKPVYQYTGEDELIKKIFDTAKRTVDLCAAGDYVWDGVKRDRLVWIGDMHPEMLALTTMYGRLDCVERSLEFVKEQTPIDLWMNGIASYSMWWAIIVVDYFFLTDCSEFAVKQLDYINGLVDKFDKMVTDDGEMLYPWFFVDWPTCDTEDMEAGVRAINIIALNKIIQLLNKFEHDTKLAKKVLDKLRKKPIEVKRMKQVAGLKYFADGQISDTDYNLLIEGGAKGMSTFMSYYILSAIASRNKDKAIEIMKEYYGAMLSIGATTFFEDFDIEWLENSSRIDEFPRENQKDIHGDFGKHCYVGFRHSFCHGWSSGVIRFIFDNEYNK